MLEQVKELAEVVLNWVKENPKTTAAIVTMPVGVYAGKRFLKNYLQKLLKKSLKSNSKKLTNVKIRKTKRKKKKRKMRNNHHV